MIQMSSLSSHEDNVQYALTFCCCDCLISILTGVCARVCHIFDIVYLAQAGSAKKEGNSCRKSLGKIVHRGMKWQSIVYDYVLWLFMGANWQCVF